jgi:hypothetical protein
MAGSLLLFAFLGIQAFLWFSWWALVRTRAVGIGDGEGALCVTVLYFAHITGASLVLGWVGHLRSEVLVPLLLLSGACLLLVALASPDRSRMFVAPCLRPALGGGVLGGVNRLLLTLVSVALTAALVRGAVSAESKWDALKYHLPMSALMLQEHQLAFGPVHNPAITGYPRNIQIWFHWILAFFKDDRWVDVAQIPFLCLGMVATYTIARRLGSGPQASVTGALLFPFAPVVLAQLTTAYTDVALSALLLSTVALLLIARVHHPKPVLLAFGCSLGLLAGTKLSAVAFAGLLLGVFVVSLVRTHGRKALPALALVVALTLFLGADAYVRNWRLHGNPVYPFRIGVRNVILLPGPWSPGHVHGVGQTRHMNPVVRLLRSWSEVDVAVHSTIFGGFGITWPLLASAIAVSLGLSIRARDRARLGVFAVFLVLFLATPVNFRVRFVIYLLGLGGVSVSHLLDRLALTDRVRMLLGSVAVLVAVVSIGQVWRHEYGLLLSNDPVVRARRADPCAWAQPPSFREMYRWVRDNAPAGSTVVLLESQEDVFPYCLWNRDFSNRVEFAAASTATGLIDLTGRRPGTTMVLPHRSAAYVAYLSDPGAFLEVFSGADVTLVRLR